MGQGTVLHALGGRDRRIRIQGLLGKKLVKPYLKKQVWHGGSYL
jgi:hypothetical protein